jgi:hypothetical protein
VLTVSRFTTLTMVGHYWFRYEQWTADELGMALGHPPAKQQPRDSSSDEEEEEAVGSLRGGRHATKVP